MSMMSVRAFAAICVCVILGACGSGGSGGPPPPPPDQPQTIAFASAGPLSGAVGTTVTNVASGGGGTGAFSYTSSNAGVATVSATGVATLIAVGTTTITATKAASTGFLSATATYTLNVTPGTQSIAFAQSGTLNTLLAAVTSNAASGGAGTGGITYASSNSQAVSINPTNGAATAVGVGTAVITATKAADTNYQQAQASYTLNVQTADRVSAWIGAAGTEVHMPASANGRQFGRAAVDDCSETAPGTWTCSFAALTPVNAIAINDAVATLNTPAYYAIENNGQLGEPIVVNHRRFSERIGHGAVRFNDRYWVIGGAMPQLPSATPGTNTFVPIADVWSSADGRSWRLETDSAAFGARWLHQTLVYNDAIWVLGGIQPGNTGYNDVWRSTDGVTWSLVTTFAPFMAVMPDPNPSPINVSAAVFDGAMWFVRNGKSFSSTDGAVWTQRSANNAIGGSNSSRGYASLNVFGNALWYTGGSVNLTPGGNGTPPTGDAANDVWRSADGISWTQMSSFPSPRFQHASFVLNNRLWVFGGQSHDAGVPAVLGTAYSTADGSSWTQEALNTEIDNSHLTKVVEESGQVTLFAGVQRSFSNKVWQTTDGAAWTERAPVAFSPRLLADGASFNGYLWLLGGSRMDSVDTSEIWRSADGIHWTQVTTTGSVFSGRSSHRVSVFNDRLWVTGGHRYFPDSGDPLAFNNEVWSSADGIAWTQHAAAPFAARASHEAVVFNGRLWIIGGTNGTSDFNDVWSSADGETWVQETASAAFAARWGHQVVALNNELWLLGGGAGSESTAAGTDEIWRSTDGRTWVAAAAGARFAPRMVHGATVHGGRMYLVGGASAGNYYTATHYNDVWSSADGLTWRAETAAAGFSPRRVHVLLELGSRLHVIGGYSAGRHHDIWRSADGGATWQVGFSHPIQAP